MRPLHILPHALAALLAVGLLSATATAQDPASEYNRIRAWQQYQNSTAPVKSISSYRSGAVWGYDTPLESGRFYRTPGYYHEYSSPTRWESFEVPQLQGGAVIYRPLRVYPPPVVPLYPYPPPPPYPQ